MCGGNPKNHKALTHQTWVTWVGYSPNWSLIVGITSSAPSQELSFVKPFVCSAWRFQDSWDRHDAMPTVVLSSVLFFQTTALLMNKP